MIAALFVDPNGVYSRIPGVDLWDQKRDARLYPGSDPVVAHPPCQLWGNLAFVNYARWGGEHNRPGNDMGCFASAVESVNRYGGVLEHPGSSRAFAAHGLLEPTGIGWKRSLFGGWVCEVWQSAYGHKARKRTWLYYQGNRPPADARWERLPGTHQISHFPDSGKPGLGKREASATPREFAEYLIELAESSR